MADEVLLKYINELSTVSSEKSVPFFIMSWMTSIAHSYLNGAKNGDEIYSNFLRNIDLSNTILFFMSDHGYRFGEIRLTFPGNFLSES